MRKPNHPPFKCPALPGFALVVALSLMILLTVVAVGMLTLASITLRAGSHSSAMAEARQNARLALWVALGELQTHAGQDQRITGTADLAGTATGESLAAGDAPLNDKSINNISKGLTAVQPGTRHWTGVWRNNNTSDTANVAIYTETPSPVFMRWLVSGYETGSSDSIHPASPICTVGSNGTVADPTAAVVLVGRTTVGDPAPNTLPQYVAAPLVPITGERGRKQGTIGRYGWWVGDEGVKAKFNSPKTNKDVESYASLSPQRRGWDAVEGFADYPSPNSEGNSLLPKLVTLNQAPLLVPSSKTPVSGLTPLQGVFHSATTDSRGLLTDTLSGGTKVDLTTILNGDLPTSETLSTLLNNPIRSGNIIPRRVAQRMVAPKWDALKDFHDRSKALQGGALTVKAATSVSSASIAPLITDLRILMGVRFVPAASGSSFKANACGKIAVGIANPYSVPLKWENDLEFEILNLTPDGNSPSRIWNLGSNSVFISSGVHPASNEPAVFNQAVFRIRPGTLQPGEAQAYTVAGPNLRPIGSGTRRTVFDMAPFGDASPADFSRCVEMDAPGVYTSFPGLDVRESWQTTLVGLEMRLGGGSRTAQPLCRIDGFELDNGYFGENTRYVPSLDYCRLRPRPIPIMCYSFQISQPGIDYLKDGLMPSGYAMGQRGSTLRTFTDFNLQATRINKPITSYNPPPYFMESNNGFGNLPDTAPGGQTGRSFTKNLDSTMPWGRGYSGSSNTVLFSVPKQFTSLAQFQHADLTGDDVAASIGQQPGNAFANSYATPFVKRAQVSQSRVDYVLRGAPDQVGSIKTNRNYYDISHLLNTALWDNYFLSTIKSSGSGYRPENPSLVVLDPDKPTTDLLDPVRCASQLVIDGAFNINSTDKNAWKAFLGSSKYFDHQSDTAVSAEAAFPRSLDQPNSSATPPTGRDGDSFAGFRRLTDAELESFAQEMVKQVRLRGPFVSLSHFVNRALGDISKAPALTRSGALQAAIDESGITINFRGNLKGLTGIVANSDRVSLSEKNRAPRADMDGGDTDGRPTDNEGGKPVWAATSTDNNYGTVASIFADRSMLSTDKEEQGYRSTGIPGWLTQADVLQVIGPSITSRSDTFRIRAYGESLDPAGKVLANAYCEAMVQRLPDYVDPSNSPSQRGTELTTLNKTYGRQFSITSFRWLSPDEI
jgi:hypothetical protein